MKKSLVLLTFLILTAQLILAYDKNDQTNDFYDNQPIYKLKANEIQIYGKIENPGQVVDFSKLPIRTVLAKETMYKGDKPKFIGTYRYIGYSLYDILNRIKIKRITGDFKSPVDLYVIIENQKGETAVISWGEIYYPTSRFQKIIATEVTPILPHIGGIKWPIPEKMKLVIGTDLITERNISNPIKITIKSIDMSKYSSNKFTKEISTKINITDNSKKMLHSSLKCNL